MVDARMSLVSSLANANSYNGPQKLDSELR